MRVNRGRLALLAVGAIGLGWLLAVSAPGSRVFSYLFPVRPDGTFIVGRVLDHAGKVTRVRGAAAELTTTPNFNADLRDGDRLETDAAGRASVSLTSQDELEVGPKSVVGFELWNVLDPNSPIYVHVLAGDVTSKRTGVRGRAFVIREGRLYAPGQSPGIKVPPLVITRVGATDLSEAEPTAPPPAATPDQDESAPARKDDPRTLANEYIDELIGSRQNQFQKCWLSRLKEKPALKGTLTVQFEITRRGKVREVQVTGSTLTDDKLASCVRTVVERLPFRTFTGPDISVAYPITFE